jgi:hypothetical protein
MIARMHPEQPELALEIEEVWLAALADAELNPDECLLYVFDGAESQTGYGGLHFARGVHIYESERFAGEVNDLLPVLNADERIGAVRILVWRERTIEGLAALIRHELEHARQDNSHGRKIEDIYHVAVEVLAERVGGLTGGALLYTVIPNELDSNAAAAMFVRARYSEERIRELLDARDGDSAAFRSLVGPPPVDTLPERMLAFFISYRDLCELHAQRNNVTFRWILNYRWPGMGDVWQQLVEEEAMRVPR